MDADNASSTPPPEFHNEKREILSFTGLRGVAAVYVMLYHFRDYKGGASPLHNFAYHGYMGVEFFFLLSGFVMAMTYRHLFDQGFAWRPYRSFLAKRFARVYPLFFVMTVLAFAAWHGFGTVLEAPPTIGSAISNFLLLQAWGLSLSWIPPGWSISTELAAYLLFPLFLAPLVRGNKFTAGVVGAALFLALVALSVCAAFLPGVNDRGGPLSLADGRTVAPLLRCLFEFGLGLLAYRLATNAKVAGFLASEAAGAAIALVIVALLAAARSDIFIIAPIGLMLVSISTDRNVVARLLGSRPLYWLGTISYSVYLVHPLVQGVFGLALRRAIIAHRLPGVDKVEIVALSLMTLILATIAYHAIERPARRLLRAVLVSRKDADFISA